MRKYVFTFTRPDNATAYAAGDVVTTTAGTAMLLIARDDFDTGRIVAVRLASLDTANTTNATFRLFFFDDNANINTNTDNSAFALTEAKDGDLIGYTDFTLETTGTSGSSVAFDANTGLDIPFEEDLDSNGRKKGIYGILTATGAYNPVAGLSRFRITLYVREVRND